MSWTAHMLHTYLCCAPLKALNMEQYHLPFTSLPHIVHNSRTLQQRGRRIGCEKRTNTEIVLNLITICSVSNELSVLFRRVSEISASDISGSQKR